MLRICDGRLGERLKTFQRRRFIVKDEQGKDKPIPFNDFGKEQLASRTVNCKFEHWIRHELKQFKKTVHGSQWYVQLLWSIFTFYWAFIFTTFVYLTLLTKKIEDYEKFTPVGNIFFSLIQKYGQLVTVTDEYYKLRDKIERKCFKEIIDARNDLIDVTVAKKYASALAIIGTFSYYLAMGEKLGLYPLINVQLSLRRLLRRRGLLWHLLLLIQFCSSTSALNYYYRCYIMSPENRALHSIPDDNPRLKTRLMSAYGGKGLALQRLYSTEHVMESSSLDLAREVALHKDCNKGLEGDLEFISNRAFYGGVGLRFRNKNNTDNIPEHCYFSSADNLKLIIEKSCKVDEQNASKKERVKRIQAKKSKEQLDKEKRERARAILDKMEGENEDKGAHFGIGKAYASHPWESRLVKATSANLTRAMLDRLEVLQLLSSITVANTRAKQSSFSTATVGAYITSLNKFRRSYPIMTDTIDLVEQNYEQHCLCSYFPFYIGFFPNRK